MHIIAGKARGVELAAADSGELRPTIGRGREALFSSLGDLAGRRVLDIFSGSGALGLEAASRGAAAVTLVELSPLHCRSIEENLRRVVRCGVDPAAVRLVQCDALAVASYCRIAGGAEIIFADPPYAKSAAFFAGLFNDRLFRESFAGAQLIWELPDHPGAAGEFAEVLQESAWRIKKCGGSAFVMVEL